MGQCDVFSTCAWRKATLQVLEHNLKVLTGLSISAFIVDASYKAELLQDLDPARLLQLTLPEPSKRFTLRVAA